MAEEYGHIIEDEFKEGTAQDEVKDEQETLAQSNGKEIQELKGNDEIRPEKACYFDYGSKHYPGDCVLVTGDGRIIAHKSILTLASPVFANMVKTETTENPMELNLPDGKAEELNELLDCIYPNKMKTIDNKNVLTVLPLVEKYELVHLKPVCEKILVTMINDCSPSDTIYKMLQIAHKHSLSELQNHCLQIAAAKGEQDLNTYSRKYNIPSDSIIIVLKKINASLRQELATSKSKFESHLKISKVATQFLAAGLPRSEIMKFLVTHDELNMDGSVLDLKFLKKDILIGKTVTLFGKSYLVEISLTPPFSQYLSWHAIQAKISAYKDSNVHVVGRFEVVNMMERKPHIVKDLIKKKDVAKISVVLSKAGEENFVGNKENGFLSHGEIQVSVYILAFKEN